MELSVPRIYRRLRTTDALVASSSFSLHAVVIYAFATGLAQMMVEKMRGPIETKIIEEAKQEKEEPPPPPPKFQAPPPGLPSRPRHQHHRGGRRHGHSDHQHDRRSRRRRRAKSRRRQEGRGHRTTRQDPRHPNAGAEEIYPRSSKRLPARKDQ